MLDGSSRFCRSSLDLHAPALGFRSGVVPGSCTPRMATALRFALTLRALTLIAGECSGWCDIHSRRDHCARGGCQGCDFCIECTLTYPAPATSGLQPSPTNNVYALDTTITQSSHQSRSTLADENDLRTKACQPYDNRDGVTFECQQWCNPATAVLAVRAPACAIPSLASNA